MTDDEMDYEGSYQANFEEAKGLLMSDAYALDLDDEEDK